MHEPDFWYRPSSWISRLLMPLAAVYGAIAGQRLQREGLDAGIPVLCVGNYHVGGAGKTPTVLALVKLLRDLGETPVVLSRGYGGRLARAGHGRSRPARGGRCRRRAADAGAHGPGGGRARSPRRRRLGAVARRHRDRDGRRLPESGDRQGCLADRDRRPPRPWQRLRVSRRPAARAAAAANRAHRCAGRDRRRHCRRGGRCRRRGAGQAGVDGASQAGRGSVASLRGKRVLAFAGIGDPAQIFQDAARQRHRGRAGAGLRRSSSVFAKRDRRPGRGSQARWR